MFTFVGSVRKYMVIVLKWKIQNNKNKGTCLSIIVLKPDLIWQVDSTNSQLKLGRIEKQKKKKKIKCDPIKTRF